MGAAPSISSGKGRVKFRIDVTVGVRSPLPGRDLCIHPDRLLLQFLVEDGALVSRATEHLPACTLMDTSGNAKTETKAFFPRSRKIGNQIFLHNPQTSLPLSVATACQISIEFFGRILAATSHRCHRLLPFRLLPISKYNAKLAARFATAIEFCHVYLIHSLGSKM